MKNYDSKQLNTLLSVACPFLQSAAPLRLLSISWHAHVPFSRCVYSTCPRSGHHNTMLASADHQNKHSMLQKSLVKHMIREPSPRSHFTCNKKHIVFICSNNETITVYSYYLLLVAVFSLILVHQPPDQSSAISFGHVIETCLGLGFCQLFVMEIK